jgi:large subunit ribosomal protein L21e
MIPLSTYLKQYKVGDIVDVVANGTQPRHSEISRAEDSWTTGAVQKGMPYKVYHGKTGIVYNVTKSAVGVILQKQVGNRYMEKRINVRVEHVRHSRSREDFLKRVKSNFAKQQKAKETGEPQQMKRMAAQPRSAHTVSLKEQKPENIVPVPYETTI